MAKIKGRVWLIQDAGLKMLVFADFLDTFIDDYDTGVCLVTRTIVLLCTPLEARRAKALPIGNTGGALVFSWEFSF